eukprot:gnl/MRDRNA2_/MRDRNA2_110776_c0_seq1.p1 gnl/MRDRNA2_/MRDRNA2_110776_c0~~gnl/MRDRNA2_/MRDRNA2_110776_c0_seq1.p1  ORF type:complete len:476 (+),score=97.66 gnl/MRDRNA2_/MRDRNA2_110776_c0_seq1:92-1519(+)
MRNVRAGSNLTERTSVTSAAVSARSFQARAEIAQGAGKSWMQDHADKPMLDAMHGGIDPQVAQSTVKCVTRFATVMCVAIAIVKIGVYLWSKAAVVKTSALDSIGDLVANCITLYTGFAMNTIDPVTYPVGQRNFEPIGVTVFTTLMASAMFANALNNVEDLLDEGELSREDAIQAFFNAAFGDKAETDEGTEYVNMTQNFQAVKSKLITGCGVDPANLPTPLLQKVFAADNVTDAWASIDEVDEEDESKRSIVWEAADEPTILDTKNKLFGTVIFLGCCATYKLCLWQYCVWVAIPRSASSILVALANDKRNDCVATSFVIICMLVGFFFKKQLGEDIAEKIDPGASLVLSLVIVYTWITLLLPQISVLSRKTVEEEILGGMMYAAQDTVRGTDVEIDTLKCYKSSAENTVEVEISVPDRKAMFKDVIPTVKSLHTTLAGMEEVERVLIVLPVHGTLAQQPSKDGQVSVEMGSL